MRRIPVSFVLAAITFCVYALTLHPGIGGRVNFGDSAKFQFIGVLLGVSHPPGNPLYLWFDALFARLPIAHQISTRINLLSATFGALTIAFIYNAIREHGSLLAAIAGALALAFGPLFWGFSTEAEVYTLSTCLFAASLWGVSAFCRRGSLRALDAALFVFVIAFANHLTIVAAIPAWIWFFARNRLRPHIARRQLVGRAAVAFAAGVVVLAIYAYVPWRVQAHAAFSEFEGKLTTSDFIDYVTAKKYRENIVRLTPSVLVNERLPEVLRYLTRQWLWPSLLVAPLGVVAILRANRKFAAFVLIALTGFFVFALVYAIPDADGFFMPVVTLIALLFGFAVDYARARASRGFVLALIVVPLQLAGSRHLSAWRHIVPWNRVVSIEATPDALWDISDVLDEIPEGATFLAPCGNYGCIQVLNYYRFTDPRVKERHLSFAHFHDIGTNWGVDFDEIGPATGASTIVCTLRKDDAEKMRGQRIIVTETARPGARFGDRWYDGVPIYCSIPHEASLQLRVKNRKL